MPKARKRRNTVSIEDKIDKDETNISDSQRFNPDAEASQKITELTTMDSPTIKRAKIGKMKDKHDKYCWICHKENCIQKCCLCPRIFHVECLNRNETHDGDWMCPECLNISMADKRAAVSPILALLTSEQFCNLLKYTLQRMKLHVPEEFCICDSSSIFYPMDFTILEKNIRKKAYTNTASFLADVKWMPHNHAIYYPQGMSVIKTVLKVCQEELREIETCPDCYLHAYSMQEKWFSEPCRKPHTLVWAKLKGFPIWPAKAVKSASGNVDVRFFGGHERAWVPLGHVYFLSREPPQAISSQKRNFEIAIQEVEVHIKLLSQRFGGGFEYAAEKTPFNPSQIYLHLNVTLSKLSPNTPLSLREKRRYEMIAASTKRRLSKSQESQGNKKDSQKKEIITEDPLPVEQDTSNNKKDDPEEENNESLPDTDESVYQNSTAHLENNKEVTSVEISAEINLNTHSDQQNIENDIVNENSTVVENSNTINHNQQKDAVNSEIKNISQKEVTKEYLKTKEAINQSQNLDDGVLDELITKVSEEDDKCNFNDVQMEQSKEESLAEKEIEISKDCLMLENDDSNKNKTNSQCINIETCNLNDEKENKVERKEENQIELSDNVAHKLKTLNVSIIPIKTSHLYKKGNDKNKNNDEDYDQTEAHQNEKNIDTVLQEKATSNNEENTSIEIITSNIIQDNEKQDEVFSSKEVSEITENEDTSKENSDLLNASKNNTDAEKKEKNDKHYYTDNKSCKKTLSPNSLRIRIVKGKVESKNDPVDELTESNENNHKTHKTVKKCDFNNETISQDTSNQSNKSNISKNSKSGQTSLNVNKSKSNIPCVAVRKSKRPRKNFIIQFPWKISSKNENNSDSLDTTVAQNMESDNDLLEMTSNKNLDEVDSVKITVVPDIYLDAIDSSMATTLHDTDSPSQLTLSQNQEMDCTNLSDIIMPEVQQPNITNSLTITVAQDKQSNIANLLKTPVSQNKEIGFAKTITYQGNQLGSTNSMTITLAEDKNQQTPTSSKNTTTNLDVLDILKTALSSETSKPSSSHNMDQNASDILKVMVSQAKDDITIDSIKTAVCQDKSDLTVTIENVDKTKTIKTYSNQKNITLKLQDAQNCDIRKTTPQSTKQTNCSHVKSSASSHKAITQLNSSPTVFSSPQHSSPSTVFPSVQHISPVMFPANHHASSSVSITAKSSEIKCSNSMKKSLQAIPSSTSSDIYSKDTASTNIRNSTVKESTATSGENAQNANQSPCSKEKNLFNILPVEKYARKLTVFLTNTLEEMCQDIINSGCMQVAIHSLETEIENLREKHKKEILDIKQNTDMIVKEMRATMETEKQNAISEIKRQCEIEMRKNVEETKKKQWCANCGKEAVFYCCWNTSYCDYPCQQSHWPQHMSLCGQNQVPIVKEQIITSMPNLGPEMTITQSPQMHGTIPIPVRIQQPYTQMTQPNKQKIVPRRKSRNLSQSPTTNIQPPVVTLSPHPGSQLLGANYTLQGGQLIPVSLHGTHPKQCTPTTSIEMKSHNVHPMSLPFNPHVCM